MASYPDTSSPAMPEDVAVVGLSCRFSGGATDPSKFWDLLYERRSVYFKVPRDRSNADAFHHASGEKAHTLRTAGGHFLRCDAAHTPFFGITSNEPKASDPAARMLLQLSRAASCVPGPAIKRINSGSGFGRKKMENSTLDL
ncbi:hypothetical protein AYO20_10944 [Fonsecaea nubica]|uniref:Beta-ketoacyl synthase-like N-terminal domain-containing protein n=1 Tax=Fonsecaea nubica TaxID=856822 RepID=A0A178C2K2_9EURO|nr:hypothetical protein AYO20_10944 [Fonsecaea nubica]OAL23694.1 hypothetical protein AYO20_10944 [Fonsecaea nubica]